HWGMSNLLLLQETLAECVDSTIAEAITRVAADLSYEGHGALFCCVSNPHSLKELVPDHSDGARVNRALRLMSRRLRITTPAHQVILKKVATIDGAIVLGPDGSILDAGCMICDPADSILARVGLDKAKRFPGARSTAAWNASLHGVAIKVWEDGPITVFKKG